MAEINAGEIISGGAQQEPLILKKNIDEAILSLEKLLKLGKQSEANILVAKSINQVSQETKKLTDSQKELEGIQQKLSATSKQRYDQENKSLDELVKKRESLKQAIKSYLKDQKEDADLLKRGTINRNEYNKRINDSNVKISEFRQRINLLNREVRQELLLTKTVGNEYQKLTILLERARTQYKNLAASGTATTQQLRAQQAVVENLNRKVTDIDNAVGQFQRNVGNYAGTFGAAASSLRSFLGAFGLIGGVALFARVLKGVVQLTIDYEYQNSRLQAVLGATKRESRELAQQQQELGRTTEFTANQYAQLQVELAKLGFPISDVKEMTKSTADAALALGSDLGEQAALSGAVLRSFGLEAKEITRVNDVLAKATASSGLDFQKLATALPYVSANAKALGISLEGTTALMGRLANSGFQASTIGTTLRNIFVKLADSSSNLSKRLKEPVRDVPSLLRGLRQLHDENIDLGEAFDLTDQRAVSAFLTLVSGVDEVEKLEKALNNANGSAEEMAHIMGDNLRGDIKLLKSAWEGLVLAITSGNSQFSKVLRSVVKLTTGFLNLITPTTTITDKFRSEQVEINALVRSIELANDDTEYRTKLLKELDDNYPNFLKNLDKETVTTKQLADRLKEVNEQFQRRVELAVVEERILEIQRKIFEAREKIRKSIKFEAELEAKLQDADDLKAGALGLTEKSRLELNIAGQKGRQLEAQESINKLQKEINSITKVYLDQQNEFNKGANDYFNQLSDIKSEEEQRLELSIQSARSVKERMNLEIELVNFRKKQALKSIDEEFNERIKLAQGNYDQLLFINDDIERKRREIVTKSELEINSIRTRAAHELRVQLTDEEKKYIEDQRKARFELAKFSLEQEISRADGVEERVDKELKLEALLLAESLRGIKVGSDQEALLLEQSQARINAIIAKGNEDRTANEIDAIKSRGENRIQELEKSLNEEIAVVRKKVTDRKITIEQGEAEIAKIRRSYADDFINAEIATIEQIIAKTKEGTEERAALEKALAKLKQDLNDAVFNQTQDRQNTELENNIVSLEKLREIYTEFATSVTALFDGLTQSRIQNIDLEIAKLEEESEKRIKLAGDNESAIKQIEEETENRRAILEQKKRNEQRKQARIEKAAALIQAGINVSEAVTKALAQGGFVLGIPWAAIVGALGAIQIAAIAARPIPAFEEGGITKTSTIIAGEAGIELYKTPSGNFGLTPNKASIMKLPIGTEIFPHDETMRMLALSSLNRVDSVSTDYALYYHIDSLKRELVKGNKEMIKAIADNAPGDLFTQGSLTYEAKKKADGSKQLIRKKTFGY